MSEKDLTLAKRILQQDITACSNLFEKNNFTRMNIVANRYLENCLFFNDYRLCLAGVFLKDMSFDYLGIAKNPESSQKINSAKVIGAEFIKATHEYLESFNEGEIWEAFLKYTNGINDYLKDDIGRNYLRNLNFSGKSFKFLLNFLNENKKYLYVLHNSFLEVFQLILVRIIHNHSCSIYELKIYIYFKFLGSLYPYLYKKYLLNNELDSKSLENDLSNYLEYIISVKDMEEIDNSRFSKNLWNIVKKWRELYIFYKNFPAQQKFMGKEIIQLIPEKEDKKEE